MNALMSSIPRLNKEGLRFIIKDAERRIHTHEEGGYPVEGYVEQQQAIIDLARETLKHKENPAT